MASEIADLGHGGSTTRSATPAHVTTHVTTYARDTLILFLSSEPRGYGHQIKEEWSRARCVVTEQRETASFHACEGAGQRAGSQQRDNTAGGHGTVLAFSSLRSCHEP
eukprot:486125-Rhodomonas_salina.1